MHKHHFCKIAAKPYTCLISCLPSTINPHVLTSSFVPGYWSLLHVLTLAFILGYTSPLLDLNSVLYLLYGVLKQLCPLDCHCSVPSCFRSTSWYHRPKVDKHGDCNLGSTCSEIHLHGHELW